MSIIGSISCVITPLTTFLAAGLLALDGTLGYDGWQWLFFVEALIPIIFSVFVFIFLPKDIKSAKMIDEEEKKVILDVFEKKENEKKVKGNISSWEAIKEVFSVRDFWLMTIGGFLNVIAADVMYYFMALLIDDLISSEDSNPSDAAADDDSCASSPLGITATLLSAVPYTTSAIVLLLIG